MFYMSNSTWAELRMSAGLTSLARPQVSSRVVFRALCLIEDCMCQITAETDHAFAVKVGHRQGRVRYLGRSSAIARRRGLSV